MASPYYRCPKCLNVSRKNDNMFEMVEISGSNTVFAVAGRIESRVVGQRQRFMCTSAVCGPSQRVDGANWWQPE